MLDAGTRPFDAITTIEDHARRLAFSTVTAWQAVRPRPSSIQRKLDAKSERDLHRGMHFPTRWEPFFTDFMTLEEVYRYPAKHFDFHRRQLTIG